MRINTWSLLCLWAMVSVAHAGPELTGTPQELTSYLLEQKKIISLSAMASEEVEVDTALVTIRVQTKDSKLNTSLLENERVRTAIRAELQQAGIAADAIKAARFSSTPNYSWYKEKPSSYEINNEIKVSVGDEAQLRAIAKIVDARKEVTMGGTEFKDSQKSANEMQVLTKALAALAAKKQVYEAGVGIKLQPVRVIEQHVYAQPVMRQRVAKAEVFSSMAMDSVEGGSPAAADFGAITYRAHVQVEYVLE